MRKIKNPWSKKEGYDCFGCSPDNPIGLHMEFFEDGDEVVSFWRPQEHYQGWVDTLHGGIISALIDETAGWVVFRKLQTAGMTSRLSVSFKKPVMTTDPQLILRAHIVESKRNFITIHVTLENAQSQLCAEGDVTYYAMNEGKSREMGFTTCDLEGEELLAF